MTNYEKYLALHSEIMNRLDAGEITTELAKDVNDLAFEKYITEGAIADKIKKIFENNINRVKAISNQLEQKVGTPVAKTELALKNSIIKCTHELANAASQLANTASQTAKDMTNASSTQKLLDRANMKTNEIIQKYPLIAEKL